MQSDYSGRPLRLFLTFYRPHRRLFALDLLFSLLSCLADLAFPYVSRQAMQNLLPLGLFRTFLRSWRRFWQHTCSRPCSNTP